MKVFGAPGVALGSPDDEGPHAPDEGALWQESMALCWFDPDRRIGGVNRLSHEPNYEGGRAVIWNTLFTGDGQYYRVMKTVPLRDGDRATNQLRTGDTARFFYDGHCRWEIRDDGAEMDATFLDNHVPVANIPLKKGDSNVFYSGGTTGHFEAGGRVRGSARVGEHRYTLNGWGYRNHSWGVRNWNSLRSHKWMAGVVDENFSFAAFSWHTAEGFAVAHGHVVRGDTMIFATKTDILVLTDIDSISHRGAIVRMTLPDGEVLRFDVRPICKGTLGEFHGTLVPLTGPCEISVGGRKAVGVFETSANVLGGTIFPRGIINGIDGHGLIDVPDWSVKAAEDSPAIS